jgi:diadenosine tetraphosphate (Ap4A) HIT family hydrolase
MSDAAFTLDPQLEADTHEIGRLDLCRVLLMDDARFPWLILVPERPGLAELIDLEQPDRARLMEEIALASAVLAAELMPDKLNVGALGNVVRQLHVHVVARFASDAAWPKPVWGSGAAVRYQPHQLGILADRLARAMGLDADEPMG